MPARMLQPLGRFWADTGHIELISSGVHFGFTFTGTHCMVHASVNGATAHNYLQYEVDGVYRGRLKVTGGGTRTLTITAPTGGKHSVWIYKATEAATGPVYIQQVSGSGLAALPAPGGPMIEFIGNSITCGAAADTLEVKCGAGEYHDQHNAYAAYGPRVARALGAAFMLSSVSGIGIYRTWNRESPSMPLVYEKMRLQEGDDVPWDFTRYSPKLVSIALGTNDLSRGDGETQRNAFDSARFVQEYTRFVLLVRSKYPDATIVLLTSPMVTGREALLLQNCLTMVQQQVQAANPQGRQLALFFFKPMKAGGCTGHPSVEDHGVMAEQLIPFFKALL